MGDFATAAAGLETRLGALDSDMTIVMNDLSRAEQEIERLKTRLAALEAPPPAPAPAPPPPAGWELVWSDEFDGPLVTPDPTKWTCGQNSWGGNTLGSEHQAWVAGQSYVRAGSLHLEAMRSPVSVSGKSYISGIVHTKGKAEWTPPLRVEVRARYPSGNGFWPGIWLLHDTHRKANTYEIDILEVMGQKPDEIYTTYHWYPVDFDHKEIDKWQKMPAGFSAEWHTYTLAWWPDEIRWIIDDKLVHYVNAREDAQIVTVPPSGPRTTAIGKPLIPDARYPMHLIMDLSLGGWGGNAPDATTPLPSALEIDWVRVSKWKE